MTSSSFLAFLFLSVLAITDAARVHQRPSKRESETSNSLIQQDASRLACKGDASSFRTRWGKCASYGSGEGNHDFCAEDRDKQGNLAAEVCPGCMVCTVGGASEEPPEKKPQSPVDAGDTSCATSAFQEAWGAKGKPGDCTGCLVQMNGGKGLPMCHHHSAGKAACQPKEGSVWCGDAASNKLKKKTSGKIPSKNSPKKKKPQGPVDAGDTSCATSEFQEAWGAVGNPGDCTGCLVQMNGGKGLPMCNHHSAGKAACQPEEGSVWCGGDKSDELKKKSSETSPKKNPPKKKPQGPIDSGDTSCATSEFQEAWGAVGNPGDCTGCLVQMNGGKGLPMCNHHPAGKPACQPEEGSVWCGGDESDKIKEKTSGKIPSKNPPKKKPEGPIDAGDTSCATSKFQEEWGSAGKPGDCTACLVQMNGGKSLPMCHHHPAGKPACQPEEGSVWCGN